MAGFERVTQNDHPGMGDQEVIQGLLSRQAGLDKLHAFMADHIVPDPDIALRRDPKMYERIGRDPQVQAMMMIRKLATSTLDWNLIPPDIHNPNAVIVAEQATKRLEQFPKFYEFLDNIMEAILRGISMQELVWRFNPEIDAFTVRASFPINKDRLIITDMGEIRLKTMYNSYYGMELMALKYVPYVFDIEDASYSDPMGTTRLYHGRGLADRLYYILYFKNNALRFLLRALERHVNPQKLLFSPPGDQDMRDKMTEILKALENDSVVVIPSAPPTKGATGISGAAVTLMGGKSGAVASQVFQKFIDEYCDRHITKIILGQTLTTDVPSVGSYSLGRVHEATFNKIVRRDSRSVADTITDTLVEYDMTINAQGVPRALWPKFQFAFSDIVDVQMFLTTAQSMIQMGLNVSEKQIREVTGIKVPDPLDPADSLNLLRPALMQIQLQQQMEAAGIKMGDDDEGDDENKGEKPSKEEQRGANDARKQGTEQ